MAGIHGSMAHLSDSLFTTAIAVYSVAMVGFVAEYSFGRRGRIAATVPTAEPAADKARELVGAGGPPVEGFASAPKGADADVDLDAANLPGAGAGAGGGASGTAAGGKPDFADRVGRWSFAITVLGVLFHGASIAVRAIAVDAVPWSNMYEFASVAGLVGVIAFVALLWRVPQIRHLGGFILLPVIIVMFLAGTVFYSKAQPLVPALQSYWLGIHVTLVSIAEGALMTSAVLTVLFLVRQRYDTVTARAGGAGEVTGLPLGRVAAFGAKLPPAATLDKVAYRVVAFAFPLYTIAIICGAIWAEAAWGRYWGWDPKETWAFIVWVIYAAYLHARATAGWKGRTAAWVNLAGFGAITFNFLVVNIVISGLHSYAGLS